MNGRLVLLMLVLVAFGGYSLYVMAQVGYLGIWRAGLASPAALQVLLDLVIACVLASTWMLADARARGTNAWPFVAVTLVAGSFGPLLYLVLRELRDRRAPALA